MQSKSEKMGTLEVIMESSCLRVYSPKYDEETDPEFVRFMLKFRNVTEPQHKKMFRCYPLGHKQNVQGYRGEGKSFQA